MEVQVSTLQDWSTLLRDVAPYAIIVLLIVRGFAFRRADETGDVWTIRKAKKG